MIKLLRGLIHRFSSLTFISYWMRDKSKEVLGVADIYTSYLQRYDIKKGDIVLDCGANVGDVTQKFLELGAKVYAFEPNPEAIKVLKSRFQSNKRMELIQKAVWIEESEKDFYFHAEEHYNPVEYAHSSTLVQTHEKIDTSKSCKVATIDIISFIEQLNKKVKLLKLDIEGAEIEILERLFEFNAFDKIEYIAVETHETIIKDPQYLIRLKEIKKKIQSNGLDKRITLDWP